VFKLNGRTTAPAAARALAAPAKAPVKAPMRAAVAPAARKAQPAKATHTESEWETF